MNKNFAFLSNVVFGIALCAVVAVPITFAETSAGGSTNAEAQRLFDSGTLKNNSKDYQGAVADFNKALSLDPNYGKAYANRASARFNVGDYHGAIHDLDTALKYFPNMPYLVELRQRSVQQIESASQQQPLQLSAQQRANANAMLQQAMLGGDFADPSTMIMMNAQRRGLVRSGPIVNPFANLIPGAVGSNGQIVNPFANAQQADTQSASSKLAAMTQGMSADDDQPTSPPDNSDQQTASTVASAGAGSQLSSREYFARGCEKSKATNYAAAIPEFSKCIEMEPGFGDAYANRGLARFHTQDFAGALQDFKEADRLIPNNQELKRYIELSKQAASGTSTSR